MIYVQIPVKTPDTHTHTHTHTHTTYTNTHILWTVQNFVGFIGWSRESIDVIDSINDDSIQFSSESSNRHAGSLAYYLHSILHQDSMGSDSIVFTTNVTEAKEPK